MTAGLPAEPLPLPPGHSEEQREAEGVMLELLSARLGVKLQPQSIHLPSGVRLEVDGACDDPPILCEAWAHQGAAKSAQRDKVAKDILKFLILKEAAQEAGAPTASAHPPIWRCRSGQGVRRPLLEGGGSTAVRHRRRGGRATGRDSTCSDGSPGTAVSLRNAAASRSSRSTRLGPPSRHASRNGAHQRELRLADRLQLPSGQDQSGISGRPLRNVNATAVPERWQARPAEYLRVVTTPYYRSAARRNSSSGVASPTRRALPPVGQSAADHSPFKRPACGTRCRLRLAGPRCRRRTR